MGIQADQRVFQVRQLVLSAVKDWRNRNEAVSSGLYEEAESPPVNEILHSLPRRELNIDPLKRQRWMPYFETNTIHATHWQSISRLLAWLRVLYAVILGNLIDRIIRRETLERRAVRLRNALERAGGTFVKLGQQAAMRIDLVPWAYCLELAKMLDRMTPFPVEKALEAIDRTIGRPWQEVFSVFDPVPIGSASIACVYQAILKDGTKVVVKVRRPKIAETFMADLQVLDWVAELAEFLSIFRPGFTRNLRTELHEILTDELDFRREGRFQQTFRNNAGKSGQTFFTAPSVYWEYSGDEVLVQEFVSGLWLWEVITAVEQADRRGLALLRQLNIDPALVARRILWAAFWSMDEHVFFHADPHPANILVRPNSEITFIDFGSCGSFNNQQRIALEQMVLGMNNRDVESMSRATIILLEPLPRVDVPALFKAAQEEYLRLLHTFNTPAEHTEYWERTSARQWMVLIQVARKFNLPLNLHMLRMIRATLLYDSIVLRLDHKLDRYHEYMLFMKDRAEMVKSKWRKRLRENSGDDFFLNVEELGSAFNDLMLRVQTTLDKPLVNLGSTVDKWIFAASVLSRLFGYVLLFTIVLVGVIQIWRFFAGVSISSLTILRMVFENRFYQVVLACVFVLNIRTILFRFRERDGGN